MSANNIAHGIGRLSNMVMVRGKGSWIWTADGRKLLDLSTGSAQRLATCPQLTVVCVVTVGVVNTGHCHPRVVAAAQKQCETLIHGQVRGCLHSLRFSEDAGEHRIP